MASPGRWRLGRRSPTTSRGRTFGSCSIRTVTRSACSPTGSDSAPRGLWQASAMTYRLVLLRHGESEWNAKNLFTGWVDVDLSDKGAAEAARGGELMRERGALPDVVHTSTLRRAIRTAQIALDELDRPWLPVRRSWRLNERHYGALQGKD